MKRAVFVLLAIFQATIVYAQFSNSKQEAYDIAMKAVTKMNEGDYEDAVSLLEISEELDPKNVNYPYERAYAYYAMEDYEECIEIIEGIIDHKDANDQYYQLLGNSYDFIDDTPKALEVYNKGLDRFPKSGRLYFEIGTLSYNRDDHEDAMHNWEKGVEVDPTFPSNYYWLSKLYINTPEKIWAALYSEIFINLEKNTDRTYEMSKMLYQAYENAINIKRRDSIDVQFTQSKSIDPQKGFEIPFNMTYNLTMSMSLPYEAFKEEGINIKNIYQLRKSFIDNWVKHKRDKNFPNALFEFHQKIIENGHFEAYNYWALLKGHEDEFWEWYDNNKKAYKDFVKWFETNEITFSEKNAVVNKKE